MPRNARNQSESSGGPPRLPPRKRQILDMLAAGKTPEEIAEALGLRRDTVYQHLRECRTRLKVKTTYELIKVATRKGVLE